MSLYRLCLGLTYSSFRDQVQYRLFTYMGPYGQNISVHVPPKFYKVLKGGWLMRGGYLENPPSGGFRVLGFGFWVLGLGQQLGVREDVSREPTSGKLREPYGVVRSTWGTVGYIPLNPSPKP